MVIPAKRQEMVSVFYRSVNVDNFLPLITGRYSSDNRYRLKKLTNYLG